jgi:two-component system cell cycle response regulator
MVDLSASLKTEYSAPSSARHSLSAPDRNAVSSLKETQATQAATKVLLVGDDEFVLDDLRQSVTAAGHQVLTAPNGEAALLSMQQDFAPIVILDHQLPGLDGLALCRALRRRYSGRVYVMFHSLRDAEADIVAGLNAGADDYLSKRTPKAQLLGRLRTARRILELEHSLELALADGERMAMTDVLTGAHNRRYLLQQLNHELDCAHRSRGALSILVFDVDHFSLVNDRHGHATGDAVLKEVIQRVHRSLQRSCDWCARMGGDEFAVVLPQTDIAGASVVAEKLRRAIAATPVRLGAGKVRLTISVGASELSAVTERDSTTADRLLDLADQNLYKSKKAGRNRVTVADNVELVSKLPSAAGSSAPTQLKLILVER